MNYILNFITNPPKILISICITISIIVAIRLIKKLLKRGQKKKEIRQATEDRFRDENLNNIILNTQAGVGGKKEIYTPYDVDYRNGEQNKGEKDINTPSKQIMIRLIEKTELSTRKFLLNPTKRIKIGSDLQSNDISVLAEGISPHQCEIFAVGNKVYIKNVSTTNKTVIKRKKERAFVDDRGVRLVSNDTIILGNVTYDITIVN